MSTDAEQLRDGSHLTEIEQLREATREAHEAIKDLRLATREAVEAGVEVRRIIHESVHDRIDTEVAEGLDQYKDTLSAAIEDATDRVFKRFDTLTEIMMGEDKQSRRKGRPSITELVEKAYK